MPKPLESHARVVLVVDDDEELRTLVCRMLERAGLASLEASQGAEALKVLRESKPDLLLLDVNMPGMNGREVCEVIRSTAGDAFFPIILMSGNDTTDSLVEGLAAGANDFIGKPFRREVLIAKVESLLKTKHVFAQMANLPRERPVDLKRARGEVAVVFVDLRGYTAFSESFDLDLVTETLEEYYHAVAEECRQRHGHIGGLSGDGILAFFKQADLEASCVEAAVKFALGTRQRLTGLVRQWTEKKYELSFGVGLAHGEGQVGHIGTEKHQECTVIGSVTNQAARLAMVANGNQILASPAAIASLGDRVQSELMGDLCLKGFRAKLEVCNILSLDRIDSIEPLPYLRQK